MGGAFEEGVKVLGHDDLTLEVSLRCLLKSCQCVGLPPCELTCVDARDSTDPNRSVSEFQEGHFGLCSVLGSSVTRLFARTFSLGDPLNSASNFGKRR